MSQYAPHTGSHAWGLPVAELGGKRACRKCGHIASGREDFFDIKAKEKKGEVLNG